MDIPRQRHSMHRRTQSSNSTSFFARIRHGRSDSTISEEEHWSPRPPPRAFALQRADSGSRKWWWQRKGFRAALHQSLTGKSRDDDDNERRDSAWSWSESVAEDPQRSAQQRPRKLIKRQQPQRWSTDLTTARIMAFADNGLERAEAGDERAATKAFARRDSDLTDLPTDDSSFLISENGKASEHNRPQHDDGDRSFDEHEMNAHFADVESSFVADPNISVAHVDRAGEDDTYLELASPSKTAHRHNADDTSVAAEERKGGTITQSGMPVGVGHPNSDDTLEGEPEESFTNTDASASPAAAAALRTHGRTISTASAMKVASARATPISVKPNSSNSRPQTPNTQRPVSQGSTVRPAVSPKASAVRPGTLRQTNGTGSTVSSRLRARPMTNRQFSQSTISSVSSNDGGFEAAFGFPTDESTSTRGGSRSTLLSRLPSLGSMASFLTGEDTPILSHGVSGSSLLASRISGRSGDSADQERPETPRANAASQFTAPTDTVIAQHVQSIQVPETIARDFRARNRSLSPEKRPVSSSGSGLGNSTMQDPRHPRKTLTLKEQNGKIDKLSKENFDLKLKIHFLDQALQSRSDDGVKDLIDQNVQLQTDLANERKETQALRRKMRDLEKKLAEQEAALAEAVEQLRKSSAVDDDDDPLLSADMHETILILRQQLDFSENKVTKLREDLLTKDLEKRKLSETMRSMASRRGEDSAGMRETIDMWQDLLNAEVGRREQAEEDISKLRDELTALRIERASPKAARHHPSDRRRGRNGSTPAMDDEDDDYLFELVETNRTNEAMLKQLEQDNDRLRQEHNAQTNMLKSHHRERDALQQEIESLKHQQRKGDGARSVAGESIFERSISRAHHRAASRASEHTGATLVADAEREDWERKEGQLRDQNAELRLKFQELERTHGKHVEYVHVLEGDYQEMEQELNEAHEDLVKIQSERDEALQAFDERESEYNQLREEALVEIQALDEDKKVLEAQLEQASSKAHKTQSKLQTVTDGYKGLQGELREITQSVMNLEDEKQANMRTIQTIEQQIAEAEAEIQKLEIHCKELNGKNQKLEIEKESLQTETNFLRSEQDRDKMRIGELENILSNVQQTLSDEQERLREIEQAMLEERQQRDVLENKSREDVQKVLDDLNADNAKSKDYIRNLRRSLSAKEVEANSWRQKLEEFEENLRDVLGDRDGTRQSMLEEIERIQHDLEATVNELDRAKMDMADKDRLLRHRDGLLESTSLESRRLSDLLEKERSSRKHDLDSFEKASRGQASHLRTIAQQESRVMELESSFTQQQRKMAALEEQYRDQVHERNNLLLALWNRLSTLCGNEWAQTHSLVSGEIPSGESISKHLPSFHKNMIAAVKQTEKVIGDFKVRIRRFEKDVMADYQTLNSNLEMRLRSLDNLERAVENHHRAVAEEAAAAAAPPPPPTRSGSNRLVKISNEEANKLKAEIKLLKNELKFHRQHPSAMAQQMLNQQTQLNPQPGHARKDSSGGASVNGGKKEGSSPARQIVAQLLRHHSTSTHAIEQVTSPTEEVQSRRASLQIALPQQPAAQPSDSKWVHRLRELERRLKTEREGRLLDRKGARQRLEEGRLENEELRERLEREMLKQNDGGSREDMRSSFE